MAAGQERFSTHQSPAPKNTQTSFQILNTVHLSYKDGFKGSILVWAVIPAESGAAPEFTDTAHILHVLQQQ